MTAKDDNAYPLLYGISATDGESVVPIKFNPANGGMKINTDMVISFTPKLINAQTDDDFPIAKGVSSADGATVLPFYVVPSTGAVLVDFS